MLSMLVVVVQLLVIVLASSGKSGQACDADNPGLGESTTINEFKLLGHQLQSSISWKVLTMAVGYYLSLT